MRLVPAHLAKRAAVIGGVLALTVTAPLSPARPQDLPPDPVTCPKVEGHVVECGGLVRPLVPAAPELGTTPVAYAVVRRTDTAKPAAGTIAVNPGGPGAAAVPLAADFAWLLAPLLTDHDLLLVDPRGSGDSGPLDCQSPPDMQARPLAGRQRAYAECGRRLGPRAAGYTTANVSDDIDAVRAHLRIDRLDLFGMSYGTYLMGVHALRHPHTVRSVVLSGAYPVDVDPLLRGSAQAVPRALRALCARSGGRCDGDRAVADLTALAARLRRTPLPFEAEIGGQKRVLELDEERLATLLLYAAGNHPLPGTTGDLLWGRIPAAVAAALAGDPAPLVAMVRTQVEGLAPVDPTGSASSIAMSTTVSCNDYPNPWSRDASVAVRREQFRQALRQTRPADFGAFSARGWTAGTHDAADNCVAWPRLAGVDAQPGHGPFPDVPALVLSGELDTNVSDELGRQAAAQFPHAHFLSVPNTGHVPSFETTGCVATLTTRFVRTGHPGDTTCLAAIPPAPVEPVRLPRTPAADRPGAARP